jgi:hypothetical protein
VDHLDGGAGTDSCQAGEDIRVNCES